MESIFDPRKIALLQRENALMRAMLLKLLLLHWGIRPPNHPELEKELALLVNSPEFKDLKPKPTLNELKTIYARLCGLAFNGSISQQK